MARFAGEKIAALRGRRTQTDLASALRAKGFGTTQTTVSRWEAGQEPRASVLPVLASELGVTVQELFEADDDEEAASMPLSRDEYALYGELTARIVAAKSQERVA